MIVIFFKICFSDGMRKSIPLRRIVSEERGTLPENKYPGVSSRDGFNFQFVILPGVLSKGFFPGYQCMIFNRVFVNSMYNPEIPVFIEWAAAFPLFINDQDRVARL